MLYLPVIISCRFWLILFSFSGLTQVITHLSVCKLLELKGVKDISCGNN